MKTALLRLLSSMKFWTLLLGLVTSLGARYGFDVDPEVYWSIVGLTGLLLGAQGLTDHGKSKAEIETRNIQSGSIQLLLIIALAVPTGVIAGSQLAGCAGLNRETRAAASAAVDCTTDQALQVAKEYGPSVELAVQSQLSDTGKLDRTSFAALAKSFASDTGRCVLARVVTRLLTPGGTDTQATPLAVDTADVNAAWDAVRREQFGGRKFAL
jgi:hypothetical protein